MVAGGSSFQWVWRPLVDGETVDLAETAPGRVVIGSTDAGLLVNAGEYGEVDGQLGEPWLARLDPDGTLTRVVEEPRYYVLEARGLGSPTCPRAPSAARHQEPRRYGCSAWTGRGPGC